MIYRNRNSFAAIIRKARAEGTLTSYDRQRGQWRAATIDWRWHIYEPAWSTMLDERQRGDDDGVEYGHPGDAREERL